MAATTPKHTPRRPSTAAFKIFDFALHHRGQDLSRQRGAAGAGASSSPARRMTTSLTATLPQADLPGMKPHHERAVTPWH
ncbi:hypothetical protein [Streptacidiphilus sp. MAP5-3]|uniref:hypothetical protein n=1 Tax=unclassified Streptacidiphilus TaxID=2643834 RepID=UPI0035138825